MARELQSETSHEKIWRITDGQGNFVKLEVEAGGHYYDMDEWVAMANGTISAPEPLTFPPTNVGVNMRKSRRVDPLTVAISSSIGVVVATVVNHLWR